MHVDDFAEVVELGLDERLVAQDSGVVDQDVHAAPLVHGRRDHGGNGVDVGDVAVVRDGLAAQLDDFRHYFGCCGISAATAVDRATHVVDDDACAACRSEEHTSELQSLMRISYAVFCLKKKKTN